MNVERMKYHPGWKHESDLIALYLWEPHDGKGWRACNETLVGGEQVDGEFAEAATAEQAMTDAGFRPSERAAFVAQVDAVPLDGIHHAEPMRCSSCGSASGVYSDDEIDPHWTCLECGDEWPLEVAR